ncbi:MAG TPA: serine hydrolase domain-containing protein [Actinomycetota bacterium]|nr:serine hydrolase domain-containing protein [Actinomycetota bacterium]
MDGLEAAFDRIGTSAEHHLEVSHSAGLALAVTDGDEVLGVVCRGLADVAAGTAVRPETRFHIGSISKSFAAMIALQEVAAGRLDLHVSVNEILPWLELPEPFAPITMHDLMTHTAGLLVGTEDAPTGPGALHRLKTNPPTTKPGERWLYSNDGWKVVGACLEEVTGEPMHELLRTRVLGPLGMRDSEGAIVDATYQNVAVAYEPLFSDRPIQLRHPLVPAHRIVSNTADGSIISTVVDMSAYARLFLARGDVPGHDGKRMLSEESFEAWIDQRVPDAEGGTYGYGLWAEEYDGARWIAHSGGMVGYTAMFAVSPDDGLGCMVMQNGYGSGLRDLVRNAFACVRASLAGAELPPALMRPSATEIPKAADYVGTYTGDDGRVFEIEAEREGLRLNAGPVTVMLERDPLADPTDAFVVPHDALERFALVFRRDADGNVVEAFHGPTWFRNDRYVGPEPGEVPDNWRRYVGFYRSNDPWAPTLRVYIRKGRLAIEWPASATDDADENELVPLDDGWFATGSEREPGRIRFLGNGAGNKAVVAEYNGGNWFRSFEE